MAGFLLWAGVNFPERIFLFSNLFLILRASFLAFLAATFASYAFLILEIIFSASILFSFKKK
nr:hypothetical protein [Metamycoplasma hominis]